MKRLLTLSVFVCFVLALQAQTLCNPVIPGYHPDPSVCRVGDDFYLVNSSFQYFPGVPIYHSKDLVNWELIGNVLDRESQLPLKGATSWLGIYAPTIRYHEGTYYMITTNVGNGGNFMVTATNPAGPWSEPIWLKQGGIDPSLWFENGKTYMMSNPDNTIMLCEIDPKTGRQLTESKPLWKGTGGRYPEAPHIYKKDGWYYLLIAEGGTEMAHSLTIARSRNIYGPYEANPANPILTNCRVEGQGMQIQGTGHGDFVQAKDGSWWIVFLAYRNYGGAYHHIGRETCLAPVEWKVGEWPVINGGKPIDTVMQVKTLAPQVLKDQWSTLNPQQISLNPQSSTLHLQPEWVYIQNPIKENYRLEGGRLWLKGGSTLTANDRPTFVGRRQESPVFAMEAMISKNTGYGGLTVYQINDGHADLYVTPSGLLSLTFYIKSVKYDVITVEPEFSEETPLVLRVESDGDKYYFAYSYKDSNIYRPMGSIECSLLSTEVVGGFTGAVVGMFAEDDGSVAFDSFEYIENERLLINQ